MNNIPRHLVILAMPRSATHFVTVFIEKYFLKSEIDHFIEFRSFRDYRTMDQQNLSIEKSLNSSASLLRITCQEETTNLEKICGLDSFFKKRTTLILNPRADFEDLLLARLIPYYHWSINRFDGLPIPKTYYSFYDSQATWSPYEKKDIQNLVQYYIDNPLPWNEKKIHEVLNEIYNFFEWFHSTKKQALSYSHLQFSTDDLITDTSKEKISYKQNYPLLKYLNQIFGDNVDHITLNNMKQQNKQEKYLCFHQPEKMKTFIQDFISSSRGQLAKKLIYD